MTPNPHGLHHHVRLHVQCAGTMEAMAAIREQDLAAGKAALHQWAQAAQTALESQGLPSPTVPAESPATQTDAAVRLSVSSDLPRPIWALAVRYSMFLLERRAPGPGVEVRVAPWAAVKILDGPASDPHNLTPPDVIELDPDVWLRLACGITTWDEEKTAGHISAVGERDDLSPLLPLVVA